MHNNKRPVYLNLIKIRLPITGMVSLAHRFTGILLFLSIPFFAYLLDQSITSEQSFNDVIQLFNQPLMKLFLIAILWSFAHHFLAGIRFLLIDADIGVEKQSSRIGAWLVVIAELVILFLIICGVGV